MLEDFSGNFEVIPYKCNIDFHNSLLVQSSNQIDFVVNVKIF